MFRRKETASTETKTPSDASEEVSLLAKSGTRASAAPSATPPSRPPVLPPRANEPSRPADGTWSAEGTRAAEPRLGEGTRRYGDIGARREAEGRKLIVGKEISLSGEIMSCDRLVVEGTVEANLAQCAEIDIAESGLFKGSASIEDAEVRGRFEGTLNVRRRLLIRSTGRVTGSVRYGQIEIECGGQISGDVQAPPTAESNEAPKASDSAPAARPNVVPLADEA